MIKWEDTALSVLICFVVRPSLQKRPVWKKFTHEELVYEIKQVLVLLKMDKAILYVTEIFFDLKNAVTSRRRVEITIGKWFDIGLTAYVSCKDDWDSENAFGYRSFEADLDSFIV